MKDFFKGCIERLDTITGIKKYTYMQINAGKSANAEVEARKEMDLWISSLVRVSEKFDYIPEDCQQKYITRMMEEDQQYQDFNSRTVWKWLDLHKDKHITHSQFTEHDLSQGKYFDELKPEIQELVNNFVRDLSDAKKVPYMKPEEVEAEGQERPKRTSAAYTPDPNLETMANNRAEYGRQCTDLHKGTILPGMPSFEEWVAMQKVN